MINEDDTTEEGGDEETDAMPDEVGAVAFDPVSGLPVRIDKTDQARLNQFRPEDQRTEEQAIDIPELGANADPDIAAGGIRIGGQYEFPWVKNFTNGVLQTAPDTLTIYKPKLRRWGDKVYTAADTDVAFTGDGDQYIIWKLDWTDPANLVFTIVATPQVNWPPEFDAGGTYGVLYQVNKTGSGFTLLDGVQAGIISAPIFSKPNV